MEKKFVRVSLRGYSSYIWNVDVPMDELTSSSREFFSREEFSASKWIITSFHVFTDVEGGKVAAKELSLKVLEYFRDRDSKHVELADYRKPTVEQPQVWWHAPLVWDLQDLAKAS